MTNLNEYNRCVSAFLPRIFAVPLEVGSEVCVKVGDVVKENQALAWGAYCLRSPVPGVITGISCVPSLAGNVAEAILIRMGGNFRCGKAENAGDDGENIGSAVIKILQDAGVLNTFVAGKPTVFENKQVPSIIVRLFGEDDSCVADDLTGVLFFQQVLSAAKALCAALRCGELVFVTSKFVREAVSFDDKAVGYSDTTALPSIKTRFCAARALSYPFGDRESLAAVVAKKFKISTDESLFVDASSMFQAYRAIFDGKCATERLVFVDGDCVPFRAFMRIRVGTRLLDIVRYIGGFTKECDTVIANGFISGTRCDSLLSPVGLDTKSLFFASKGALRQQVPLECVRCNACRSHCPQGLPPDILYKEIVFAGIGGDNIASACNLCTDCGLCNLVCPARLPLCQTITLGRKNGEQ